jgi:uncharacterized YigZ family protein
MTNRPSTPVGADRTWLSPAGRARAETRVRNSRFLADIEPVSNEEAATRHLARLREEFPRATHHCWGWRLWRGGTVVERASDAGEPSGTAGAPILRALQSAGVEGASCVVVRWFGGTKLGVGPLARAYRDAAAAALEATGLETRQELRVFLVTFPHDTSGEVRRVVARIDGRILAENHGARAGLRLAVPAGQAARLAALLADASRGLAKCVADGQITMKVNPGMSS